MSVQLHLGDCLDIMRGFEPECIDLTVTSPPYDNLRTYKGFTFDFEPIARELYRVTKPGGVVVWVVGDATVNGSETGTSFRQALYFKECGFNLHDTMIYQKQPAGMRGSIYGYNQSFEYMFVFSKGRPKTFNPIADKRNNQNYKIQFHKRTSDGKLIKEQRELPDEYSRRLNVWHYLNGGGISAEEIEAHEHPAVFPEALARDHILSWSNPGDSVLDCFMGSGTTGKMAVKYQRHFIGIEIAPEYMAIAEKRIHAVQMQPQLWGAT